MSGLDTFQGLHPNKKDQQYSSTDAEIASLTIARLLPSAAKMKPESRLNSDALELLCYARDRLFDWQTLHR